jgi:hypothetical protein
MSKYTKLGFGDCTPSYLEDDRPQCEHCNNHHDNDGEYCSHRCWYLDRVGEYKAQIFLWVELGMNDESIIETMGKYGWFESMTDSSVGRFKRAIHALFEVKLAEAA